MIFEVVPFHGSRIQYRFVQCYGPDMTGLKKLLLTIVLEMDCKGELR